jgi:hypothetical protein
VRDDLKRAFAQMITGEASEEVLMEILKRQGTKEEVEIVTGDQDEFVECISKRVKELIDTCVRQLLLPYGINTRNVEVRNTQMVIANLDIEIVIDVPLSSVVLVKKGEWQYIHGFAIVLEKTELTKEVEFSLKIVDFSKEEWEKGKLTRHDFKELAVDMMVNLFGADRKKVIALLDTATNTRGSCGCPKCVIQNIIEKQWKRSVWHCGRVVAR